MGSKRLIWVAVGKTFHQAWLLECIDPLAVDAINEKSSDEQVLIQWESVRYREWVSKSSVHFEMPTIRRRQPQTSENSQPTELQKAAEQLQPTSTTSDSETCLNPCNSHPIISEISEEVSEVIPSKKQPEKKRPRVLEFLQEVDPTTMVRPKRTKSPLQPQEPVTSERVLRSAGTGMDKTDRTEEAEDETQKVHRRESHPVNNVRATKNTLSGTTSTTKKNFMLRDLEADENFTEVQLRVFNELWTGENLFTPRSQKPQRRKIFCGTHKGHLVQKLSGY